MKDFLPFGDNFSRFLEAALLPALVAVGLFAFIVYPEFPASDLSNDLALLSATEIAALIGISSLVVAMVATAMRPQVQALLEGHYCRRLLAKWQTRHQTAFDTLKARLTDPNLSATDFITVSRRMRNYPAESRYVMPTRLGNRIRAAETYGITRFGLDTPTFYFELRNHAGEQLVSDLDRSTLAIESMVSAVIVAAMFAAASVSVAVWGTNAQLIVPSVVAGCISIICYYGAWASAKGYLASMRAIVHGGRLPLAAALGLHLPPSLEDERKLWLTLNDYAFWGPGSPEPWPGTAARQATWTVSRRLFMRDKHE